MRCMVHGAWVRIGYSFVEGSNRSIGRVWFQICDVCDNFVKRYPTATTPVHYGGGINFRLARGQTEFDDDVDVAGIGGQIDRRFPLSLAEMLIVTLPCIIPFVDVKCSTVAWHTVHEEMRKRSTESARIPQHSGSCVIKGRGRQ